MTARRNPGNRPVSLIVSDDSAICPCAHAGHPVDRLIWPQDFANDGKGAGHYELESHAKPWHNQESRSMPRIRFGTISLGGPGHHSFSSLNWSGFCPDLSHEPLSESCRWQAHAAAPSLVSCREPRETIETPLPPSEPSTKPQALSAMVDAGRPPRFPQALFHRLVCRLNHEQVRPTSLPCNEKRIGAEEYRECTSARCVRSADRSTGLTFRTSSH